MQDNCLIKVGIYRRLHLTTKTWQVDYEDIARDQEGGMKRDMMLRCAVFILMAQSWENFLYEEEVPV